MVIEEQCCTWKRWARLYQDGKRIESFFEMKNAKRIAIYGMGEIGLFLCEELKGSEYNVVYAIDRLRKKNRYDIPVIGVDDIDESIIDIIVVTPISYYDEITKSLSKKIPIEKIIGIDTIILSLLTEEYL